ncbi:hypothetical protein [Streptacidiphilus rugosus]|uniref:hypothetical protein n=1 Tax=Streptacidiphilus rugosus TaxID=405783 RepID=UPI0012F7C1F2|nr:hypothetical protein [Streptacidiphilus rugosus]
MGDAVRLPGRKALTAITLAATLSVGVITAAAPAHAASGGGCRAWYDYRPGYDIDVQVRPCISASGDAINGSGYLLGGIPVDFVIVQLLEDGNPVDPQYFACGDLPAGECTVADNTTFGSYWPKGHQWSVEMFVNVGGEDYGPIQSPILYR